MREIKFREPLYMNKKFTRWHYWGFMNDAFIGPAHIRGKHYQFTGLLDKSGVEIYEGDVGKIDDFYLGDSLIKTREAIIVKYEDDGFGVYKDNDDYVCCLWDAAGNYNLEIIGNIYENGS